MLTFMLLLVALGCFCQPIFSLALRLFIELFGTAIGAVPDNHVQHFADWWRGFFNLL